MKPLKVASLIAIAVMLVTATSSGCAAQQSSDTNPTMQSIDTVKNFRYELYLGGKSEVYYYSNKAQYDYATFYSRNLGDDTGWSYTVSDEAVKALTQLAIELNLDRFPFTKLSDEDKSRNRWIIAVECENGKQISIVSYLSDETRQSDDEIRSRCEAAFKAIPIRDADGKMMGEFTKTVYSNGKKVQEIYYTRDGIVHGGKDFTIPDKKNKHGMLPPKTY